MERPRDLPFAVEQLSEQDFLKTAPPKQSVFLVGNKMKRFQWKQHAEKALECNPGAEQDFYLQMLHRELVEMGYGIKENGNDPGILHNGNELPFNEDGYLLCNCRKAGKPIKDPMQGVILRGWLLGADVPRDGNLTGYFMGCGTHMGPHVFCRECFERQMPWNQEE